MKNALTDKPEREATLLQSVAADMLFPGGVMEMERANSFTNLQALYEFAAKSEAEATEKYRDLASRCVTAEVRNAFLSIAQEESGHLNALRQRLE